MWFKLEADLTKAITNAQNKPKQKAQNQNERLFLKVPFAESGELKALNIGARWHQDLKQWSVPLNVDQSKLKANWLPINQKQKISQKITQKAQIQTILRLKTKKLIKTTVFPRKTIKQTSTVRSKK